ncbi:MAG: energy transducer TonB [Terriglobia bacterium]|jgi:TonB family protein
MFSTLKVSAEDRHRRGVAFTCGLLSEVLLICAAVFLGIFFPHELQVNNRHYAVTWLPALTPAEKPVVQPPREMARVFIPKLKLLETPKLIAPSVANPEVPKIRQTVAALPIPEPPMPAPPVSQPSPPPKEQIAVHTGLFGGAAEPVTTKRPVEEVQTGGFGNPQGLPVRAQGENPGNAPKLGSFGLPEGPGTGNGTGGSHGIQGVVASAGFGSGVAGMGNGRAGGGTGEPRVTLGGFEKAAPAAPSTAETPHVPPPAEFQPVEILSKPAPAYTEEARRLGIQGEVTLSVVFQANGAIRVIAVVRSLGHGLDQAAEQAATQIRFKPAQRSGQRTDFPANLRIQFRLADQST